MVSTNMNELKSNLNTYIDQAVIFNDVINISTENGNALLISETDYKALLETLYLSSSEKTRQEILEGKSTPVADCVVEDEVEW